MTAPLVGSAARIDATGKIYQLGPKSQPDQNLTEDDVADATKLTKLLVKMLGDIAALRRRYAPRRIDFEDIVTGTSGATFQLQHNLSGRVRWWLVGWSAVGTSAPVLKEFPSLITSNTLALQSYVAGTATIRVEEAG